MTNTEAISSVTDAFYKALNVLFTGDSKPMKDIWAHAEDVTYMGPDGLYLIGWEKIEDMWNSVAEMKLGGRVNPKQVHKVVGADMALITCIEFGENEIAGKSENVSIRSSTTFHNRDGSWKVVAHQTDLLKYMES